MNEFTKDTDGFFARHFDRKISGAISQQLLKTPITPNQITIAVTFIGIGAGWLLAQPGTFHKTLGTLVFLLTSILDGCDGEVARAKKMTSKLGGWLDLWGDNVVHVAVFWGMAVGLFRDSGTERYLFLGKLAVGGTLLSAALASFQMVRQGRSSFTSVVGDAKRIERASAWKRFLTQASDALARRDFIYAIPFLALMGWLSYFLWACAIGVTLYTGILLLLTFTPERS